MKKPISEITVKMATTNKPKNVRESEQKVLDAIVNGKHSKVLHIFINMFLRIKFHTYNLRVLHELKVIAIEH